MAEKLKYDRGTMLSIFKNDRAEDMVALVLAGLIALAVYIWI